MNGPRTTCPMAQHLRFPSSELSSDITSSYTWALDTVPQPGTNIVRVLALRVAGYASSTRYRCECLIKAEIQPQRFVPPLPPEPPRVQTRQWCRSFGETIWAKERTCPGITFPNISTESAMVALGAAQVEGYIDNAINRERIVEKMRTLGAQLQAQSPHVGQEVSWSRALVVLAAEPISPKPTTDASTGIYIGWTNQINLDDVKKQADPIWVVEDYDGHRYLALASDVDWVE